MIRSNSDTAAPRGPIDNNLRIGDIVTLKYLKRQGYLSAEGILVEDVYISPSIKFFEENLFQICCQRQYSAINELEDFNEKLHPLDEGSDHGEEKALSPSVIAHLEALVKGKENEIALNKSVMKGKTGSTLVLGDVIQLKHIKSLKYVTIRPKDLARDEKENMKVGLSSDGSVLSWLKLMPHYKINREGETVTNHMEVLLQVSEKSSEYLHCAERHPPKFKHREVNSSMELPTPWKISLYQSAEEISEENSNLLLAGQLVFIKDPESQCALAPLSRPLSLDRHHHPSTSHESSPIKTKWQKSAKRATTPLIGRSIDDLMRKSGELILTPIDEEVIDTSAIWMLETRQIVKGGTVHFKSDKVRLRHLNTGKYMVARPSGDIGDQMQFDLDSETNDFETLFSISVLHNTEEVLKNSKAIQLSHADSGAFFERGPKIEDSNSHTCLSTKDSGKAINMIINRYWQIDRSAGGKKLDRKGEIVLDIYFTQAVYHQMTHFVRGSVMPKLRSCDSLTLWPHFDLEDRALFDTIISRAILFLKGFPILLDPTVTDMSTYKIDNLVIMRRQNMFLEMGILQEILVMLNFLQPISGKIILDDQSEDAQSKWYLTVFMAESREVLNQCLLLLFEILKGNQRSQMYISDHLLVILAHISTNKMAANIARELLSSNRELQETKIGVQEITIFAEKMREIQMNSLYLELLQTCCSCLGAGVSRNQDIVNSIVFKTYSDVLISMEVVTSNITGSVRGDSSSDIVRANWHVKSQSYKLYIEPYLDNKKLRSATLCVNGLPRLYLVWVSKTAKAEGRYKKPIESFYGRRRDSIVPVGEKQSFGLTDKVKKEVGEFFIGQLQLVAEMCLGRNYPVMSEMEVSFPYETLLTILKNVRDDRLKAAAGNLIHNLYIDRDPQTTIKLPRYTRTLSDIVKSSEGLLVCVDSSRVCEFGLLQSIISYHFNKLKGKPFAQHTSSFTNILHKLVTFHFYGQLNRMVEVTQLLVSSLERGSFDVDDHGSHEGGISVAALSQQVSKHKKRKSKVSMPDSFSVSVKRGISVKVPSVHGEADGEDEENEDDDEEEVLQTIDRDNSERDKSEMTVGPNMWKDLLAAYESPIVNALTLLVAIVSLAQSAYLYLSNDKAYFWTYFNYAVYGFYLIELLLHFTLHVAARQPVKNFFLDFFNDLEILLLVVLALQYFNFFNIFLVATASRFIRFISIIGLISFTKMGESVVALLNLQKSNETEQFFEWVEADRYKKTSEYTLKTMVKMVQTLCSVQENIADFNMSQFLKSFSEISSGAQFDEVELKRAFENIFSHDAIQVSSQEKDLIYLDLMMYHYSPLVQISLQLLMTHHSSRRLLLSNMSNLQLITSNTGEKEYELMESIVIRLRRNADTHEIWGKLLQEDHKEINKDMFNDLNTITEYCKKRREVLEFDQVYEPIKFSQNILRNLGCFDICVRIMALMSSINHDDVSSESHLNTRNLVLMSNNLLYWFVLDNSVNQKLAFGELSFFIRTVDEKINSHKVILAIFKNNLRLMELVPKKHIGDFLQLILANGKRPEYLALMSSIINVGEKNVIANQYEVIKLMSTPDNVKKVIQYFCPVRSPEYAKKIELMKEFIDVQDITVDQLPAELAYHLELMSLMSRCTIGVSGMTTIEAKVQSMFFFVDILEALLDSKCMLLGKIRLGLFLFNSVVDVETNLPALKDADCIWKFIASTEEVFAFAKDELRQIEKNGWSASTSNRQKIEYMIVCAMIVNGYFSKYYDPSIFRPDIGQSLVGVKRVEMKEMQANELIKSLYSKITLIYEMVSPLLSETHHTLLFNTLVTLNEQSRVKFVANVSNLHDRFLKSEAEYALENNLNDADASFNRFITSLSTNKDIETYASEQLTNFVDTLESLPWKSSPSVSDVRFEPLIEKIVSHIRFTIQVANQGDEIVKSISPEGTATARWMLEIFRTMIEKRWGMTIFERDEEGGEEQDEAIADILGVYHSSGITEMCLDLISRGIDEALQSEALKLLVGMLFKEGGALPIQKTIYAHLSQPGSDMFFKTVRSKLQSLIAWHKWNGVVILEDDKEPELPPDMILVRCLQLMCEGHFTPNQDLLRDQPNNLLSVNLLDDLVLYLQALDPIKCKTSSTAEGHVCALVLEVLQGPCPGNQDYFALSTELLETINKKIRQQVVHDCDENEELELKKGYMEIMQGLLEGQGKKTAIFERVLSVIHIDVILVLCKGVKEFDDDGNEKEESEESLNLRVESLVLLQMLVDFKPGLKKELNIDDEMVQNTGANVVCIEVVWRGELQRRFFLVPSICDALAQSTKDDFIASVRRTSAEEKLFGLLEAAKDMYREITHQKFLNDFGVDKIFSRTMQYYSTWASFLVVFTINGLYLFFYKSKVIPCDSKNTDDAFVDYTYYASNNATTLLTPNLRCTEIFMDSPIPFVTRILNYALIGIAFFTLLLYFVVRVPVNYRTFLDSNMGVFLAVLYTAIDFQTMYYVLYLGVAVLGIFYHAALSFLLLDFIALSASAKNVLLAIYNPRKQLFMTTVLLFVFLYIFAFFQFFFINTEENWASDQNYITLMNSFKFLVRLGFPYASPQNLMSLDIGTYRIINDVLFFIMSMLMLNILKGITIDTFVELRKVLEARMKDTLEKCFICGIEKNTFNRTLDRDAFRVHTKIDQNLWNYIFFVIFLWEQDKDDDDGLETYVRRCVAANDLSWLPINKALRLAQHLAKGDITSLKYKFRQNLKETEEAVQTKMKSFKDQLGRSIARIEKSLQYEADGPSLHSLSRQSLLTAKLSQIATPFHSKHEDKLDEDALDADINLKMHVRVVFVSGLNIDTEGQGNLFIRISTDLAQKIFYAVDSTTSTLIHHLSTPRKRTIRFDSAIEESTLVWQGHLHDTDLTKLSVLAQVLYGSSDNNKFIGGVKIPVPRLLEVADSGAVLEIEFDQIQFERDDYELGMSVVEVDEDGKAIVPAATGCVLGFSAVASPELLEEFNFRGSRPASARHFKKTKK